MSRLQDYLKTPNPIQPEFFMLPNYHQEQVNELFSGIEAQLIKGVEESSFAVFPKSPHGLVTIKKSPYVGFATKNEQKIIQQKLSFDDISDQIQTPIAIKQKDQNLHTTANKKYDLRLGGTIMQTSIDNKEGQRTLRVLTAQAYDVVCRRGPITYKLVSEQIINDTCDLLSNRQQNNIKRRVYDALNVLIALGKLEKKGRKIFPSKQFEVDKVNRQKICQLKKSLLQKQDMLKSKKKLQKNLLKKHTTLNKLVVRNTNNQVKNSNIQKIKMPFLISSYQNFRQLNQKERNFTKVTIKQSKNSILFGDLDAIDCLKLTNK